MKKCRTIVLETTIDRALAPIQRMRYDSAIGAVVIPDVCSGLEFDALYSGEQEVRLETVKESAPRVARVLGIAMGGLDDPNITVLGTTMNGIDWHCEADAGNPCPRVWLGENRVEWSVVRADRPDLRLHAEDNAGLYRPRQSTRQPQTHIVEPYSAWIFLPNGYKPTRVMPVIHKTRNLSSCSKRRILIDFYNDPSER